MPDYVDIGVSLIGSGAIGGLVSALVTKSREERYLIDRKWRDARYESYLLVLQRCRDYLTAVDVDRRVKNQTTIQRSYDANERTIAAFYANSLLMEPATQKASNILSVSLNELRWIAYPQARTPVAQVPERTIDEQIAIVQKNMAAFQAEAQREIGLVRREKSSAWLRRLRRHAAS